MCCYLQDEGSFQLGTEARWRIAELGSDFAMQLGWRDMWAFVAVKGGNKLYPFVTFVLYLLLAVLYLCTRPIIGLCSLDNEDAV